MESLSEGTGKSKPWFPLIRKEGKWGARHYALPDGTQVPSVTTILQVVGKPALVAWAARTERELVMKSAVDVYTDYHNSNVKSGPAAFELALDQRIGKLKAYEKEQAKALDIGKQAHALAEWWIRKQLGQVAHEPVDSRPEALQAFAEFQGVWARLHIKPLVVEQAVWHPEQMYAGTMDLYAHPLKDETDLGVWDLKSSKAIYDEQWMQVAAYAKAVEAMGHGPCRHVGIIRLPKTPGDHVEVQSMRGQAIDDAFEAFCSFHQGFRWLEARRGVK